ncbi:MAG: DNA polymerase III subunit beta [Patescibacteria group bacterium]
MKIICLQENLKDNLIVLERICSKNQTLPILGNIILKTQQGSLQLFATDLEIGVEIHTPCKVEQEGEVVLPIKLLSAFIYHLPNIKISIQKKGNYVLITADDFTTKIPTISIDEFPLIPKIQKDVVVEIQPQPFQQGIIQVLNAVATSHTLNEISGIFLNIQPNTMKIVGTDSFRLSEKTVFQKNNYTTTTPQKLILPYKTAYELSKIINQTENVKIYIEKNQILLQLKNTQIISRLISGEYPNYEQIIPKTSKTKITILKNELISKLKLASLFSSKINDIRITTNTHKKELMVFAADQQKGEFQSTITTDMTGESCEATFNYKYLLDGLSNILDDVVLFELNGPTAPGIFKTKQGEYQYIIMPLKI